MTFQFREDGYFNMTKAAKHFGKEAKEFTRLPSTQDYVRALSEAGISHVTISKQGYHLNPEVGTWGHPKLAVFFARWLDVKFAVWCDMVIDDLLRGKAEVTITKPEESAVLALPSDYTSVLRELLTNWTGFKRETKNT